MAAVKNHPNLNADSAAARAGRIAQDFAECLSAYFDADRAQNMAAITLLDASTARSLGVSMLATLHTAFSSAPFDLAMATRVAQIDPEYQKMVDEEVATGVNATHQVLLTERDRLEKENARLHAEVNRLLLEAQSGVEDDDVGKPKLPEWLTPEVWKECYEAYHAGRIHDEVEVGLRILNAIRSKTPAANTDHWVEERKWDDAF